MDEKKIRSMIDSLDSGQAKNMRDIIMAVTKGTPMEGQLLLVESMQKVANAMVLCNVVAFDVFIHHKEIAKEVVEDFGERASELSMSWESPDIAHANELMKTLMYEVRTRCTEVCKEYQNRV